MHMQCVIFRLLFRGKESSILDEIGFGMADLFYNHLRYVARFLNEGEFSNVIFLKNNFFPKAISET